MSALRIVVVGIFGRMGRRIAELASDDDRLAVVAGLDRTDATKAPGPFSAHGLPGDGIVLDGTAGLPACDVVIDFSSPTALAASIDKARAAGAALIVGTTGLDASHHALLDAAARDVAVLQAANTSVGVQLLIALVADAAARLGPPWAIEITELHHRHKVDAPSGTAVALRDAACAGRGLDPASSTRHGRQGHTGPRGSDEIGVHALRGGDVAGEHTVLFCGEGERLELTHRATDRGIFARGALDAAVWIAGRPAGRYTMADVLSLGRA